MDRRSQHDDQRAVTRRRPRGARVALALLAVLLITTAAAFAVLSVLFSPVYMFRWAAWQDADVGDHARFPARPIAAAPESYAFGSPADSAGTAEAVRRALESSDIVGADADGFLEGTGTQAFIVIRDDIVLYEEYFGGFQRDSLATSFSVAKSYVSALIGIAIDEGAIGGVDDPITDYVPELLERDGRFADVTLSHLLDMTSGIGYDDIGLPWGDDALSYYFDDLRELAMTRSDIEEPPGERWHYVDYNLLLLGLVLERSTGMHVADYLAEKLWTRIGTEFDASWSLDRDGGFEKMESGINARPIDFARLGRLYLAGGTWDGDQVVPAGWVERSTRPSEADSSVVYPARFEQEYGRISHRHLWWRIALPDGSYAYSALGNHGQFVFVSPADGLIVVRNGERYGVASFEWFDIVLTLAEELRDGQ